MAYTKFTGWENTTLPKKMRSALANIEDGVQQGIDAAAAAQKTANAALPKAGGAMSGPIDMNSNKITELATPAATTDAANKSYVDAGDSANATAAANAASAASAAQATANAALPKAGGTMSGPINMGTKQITNLADPTSDQHAATKKYVDAQAAATASQIGAYLPLAGGTMSGPIAMGSKKITGMADPQSAQDAATKKYVDGAVSPVSTVADAAASAASSASTAASNAQSAIDTHIADTSAHVSGLTAGRALVSDASGKVGVSPVTATELGYLDGATSNIQTQLNTLSSEKLGEEEVTAIVENMLGVIENGSY